MKSNVARDRSNQSQPFAAVSINVPSECEIDVGGFMALLCSRGPGVAEDVVFAALEDMAAKIERMRIYWMESQLEELRPLARRLHKISDGAGLTSLSAAVEAFRGAVASENSVAMSATFQRIDRSFDASVEAIWQVLDEI